MKSLQLLSFLLLSCIITRADTYGGKKQEALGSQSHHTRTKKNHQNLETKFRLYTDTTGESCQIFLNQLETLDKCNFNISLPLAIIVHGWSMDGVLEGWIWKMAAALKSQRKRINVIIADWLTLAHQHYPIAVQNTRYVGQEIADFLEWLEESIQFSRSNAHLIGYSLGAHVSGFAGSFISGTKKIGRITGIAQTVKCAHERSVHLFIDSLLHTDKQSTAYWCNDINTFNKGMCLSCKNNRCNTLGYTIREERLPKSRRLFLKTRAQMPFKVYHYQFKIHFINEIEGKQLEPTFTMSLTGTKKDAKNLPITLVEGISGNKTYSFLVTLDNDIGELIMIKFKWEGTAVWENIWDTFQTIIPWTKGTHRPGLIVKTIRVKAGETQQKMTFCPQSIDNLHPTQAKTFVRCEDHFLSQNRK
ncbi:hepatic triacylglycerol lipase isoform X2 [Melanerpes formicivorus]|uniref:hepatic triacylglycerol lipase isoform X2 n=1 Tax=Melanerpes formicivorus TaxID=211600 RepID=UPI00358F8597